MDGVRVDSEFKGERKSSRFDRVLVAVPVEQAADIASEIDLEIVGKSSPCIVAWGPCETLLENPPEGFSIYKVDEKTTLVELSPEISHQLIDQDKALLTKIITERIGLSDEGWKSHKWRYSRASSGPGSVISRHGVSFIGDAFGKDIGFAGAALDSAARAVSNMHLSILDPEFNRRPVQSSLSDW